VTKRKRKDEVREEYKRIDGMRRADEVREEGKNKRVNEGAIVASVRLFAGYWIHIVSITEYWAELWMPKRREGEPSPPGSAVKVAVEKGMSIERAIGTCHSAPVVPLA
jgi:hypothetical protein